MKALILTILFLAGVALMGQETSVPAWPIAHKPIDRLTKKLSKLNQKLNRTTLSLGEGAQVDELSAEVEAFQQQIEAFMGQPDVIAMNQRLESVKQELVILRSQMPGSDAKAKLTEKTLKLAKTQLGQLKKSFDQYLSKYPSLKELQSRYLNQKMAMPTPLRSASAIENLQSQASLEELVSQRMGGAHNEALKWASGKLIEAEGLVQQARNEGQGFKNQLANDEMAWKGNRLIPGISLGLRRAAGNLAETQIGLGYRMSPNWTIGTGVVYQLGLGNGLDELNLKTAGLGYSGFLEYRLSGKYFTRLAIQQFDVRDPSLLNRPAANQATAWNTEAIVGLGYAMHQKLAISSRIMILYHLPLATNTRRFSPLEIKFGFDLIK